MKLLYTFVLLVYAQLSVAQLVDFQKIPKQTYNPFEHGIFAFDVGDFECETFEISNQITVGQYKLYLDQVAYDSSITSEFYQSQLPQQNALGALDVNEYLTNPQFSNLPVAGVTWEAALYYCYWLEKTQRNPDQLYEYLLPDLKQFGSALLHTEMSRNNRLIINENYADWLLNSKNESIYAMKQDKIKDNEVFINYIMFAKPDDPPSLKRKLVFGDSYKIKHDSLFEYEKYSYYQNKGYEQVGFRVVRKKHIIPLIQGTGYKEFSLLANYIKIHPGTNENLHSPSDTLAKTDHVITIDDKTIRYQTSNGFMNGFYQASYPESDQIRYEGFFVMNERKGLWKYLGQQGELLALRYYFDNLNYRSIELHEELDLYQIKRAYFPLNFSKRDSNNNYKIHFVHEADVAWSKRLWRRIDLDENPALKQIQKEFLPQMLKWIQTEQIKVYSAKDDQLTIEIENEDVDQKYFTTYSLVGFELKEDLFIDNKRLLSEYRQITLTPIIKGEKGKEEKIYAFYYPYLRKFFAQIPINDPLAPKVRHFDDLFYFRHFNDRIIAKAAMYDREVQNKIQHEEESIKIIEKENSVMEYYGR